MVNVTQQHALLEGLEARIRRELDAGVQPVVVFDLDHTLFDNGPRTWTILAEFAEATGRRGLRERLNALPKLGLPYLLKDALKLIDETDEILVREALDFWLARFFQDSWIDHDVPVPGAPEFARSVFELGATVVYLTGRDSPNMLIGTAQSLRRHGFPVGVARTCMVLKPDFATADLAFKTRAAEFVVQLGTVVASFDNEPANCNLFLRQYAGCTSVLLETAMGPNPEPLDPQVVTMINFLRA